MPLAIVSSKFYMSLTLPTPEPEVGNKSGLYVELEGLSLVDSRLQPRLLDDEFFKGLDQLFLKHLLPSFQTFGIAGEITDQFDQNNAPVIDDLEEEVTAEKSASQEEEMLSLNWSKKFWEEYVPAVTKFVAAWVGKRKSVLKEKSQVAALDSMEEKVAQYFEREDDDTSGFPTVGWHSDRVGVPLMTPTFLSALLGELNAVQDAAVSVSNQQVS